MFKLANYRPVLSKVVLADLATVIYADHQSILTWADKEHVKNNSESSLS